MGEGRGRRVRGFRGRACEAPRDRQTEKQLQTAGRARAPAHWRGARARPQNKKKA